MADDSNDHILANRGLILRTAYRDPSNLIRDTRPTLSAAYPGALIALDTNVLLSPYEVGGHTLDQLNKAFRHIADQGRLRIPGDAVREFYNLRPEKISNSVNRVTAFAQAITSRLKEPMLSDIESFKDLQAALEEHNGIIRTLKKLSDRVVRELIDGLEGGTDPVLEKLRSVIADNIVDLNADDLQGIESEAGKRAENKIPPGYKDRSIGDFLIWKTILRIARNEKRDAVFVTGETKPDWCYRKAGRITPRQELVEEYRLASEGAHFYLCNHATLLELAGAEIGAIEEVRKVEEARAEKARVRQAAEWQERVTSLETQLSEEREYLQNIRYSRGSIGRYFGGAPEGTESHKKYIEMMKTSISQDATLCSSIESLERELARAKGLD